VKLRAKVTHIIGNTRHAHGHVENGVLIEDGELPKPASVEIEPDGGAFLLVYFDAHGMSITDTWHQTLDDAKGQAEFEFGIMESDWQPIAD
jgi:hypothetical protein